MSLTRKLLGKGTEFSLKHPKAYDRITIGSIIFAGVAFIVSSYFYTTNYIGFGVKVGYATKERELEEANKENENDTKEEQ